MILDREKALREALAAPEHDPALHGLAISEELLNDVRGLEEPPSLSDAVLHLTHAIATSDAPHISIALHENHPQFGLPLIQTALQALDGLGTVALGLECRAFAHYELKHSSVGATLPEDFNFHAWTVQRETNARVTNAGFARAAQSAQSDAPKGYLAQRPWLLELVLEQSATTRNVVSQWWGLIVPALLNYLDTTDLAVRARGTRLTTVLAQRFGPQLRHSGLVPVFEAAVEPCLSFVPPLVEPERTRLVLRPAVLCLGALAQLAADRGATISRLNQVAREGCLKPFLHANENVELTIYFFENLHTFVDSYLQSLTAAHLSGIVRAFTQVMTDPFIDFSRPLIDAASGAMAACITWAWPRIAAYKYNILLGLTKANALDTECFTLLQVSADEERELRERVDASRDASSAPPRSVPLESR